ncbi:MAG: glycine--tRNA ligase subunit beta, partial [Rhodospirillaceae bacterium]|nr:glycine--tRNA ligase subunit beta [Rhodospirillaceae bacterium]
MAELLFELLSEEIPARMQAKAAADLERLVVERLKEARLEHGKAQSFVTPRRLALVVDGLPDTQPDISVERKGPKVDAPEKAIAGFLKSTGLTLDQCEQRETPKGMVWFAVSEEKGRATAEVLAELIPEALEKLPWAKSMRW